MTREVTEVRKRFYINGEPSALDTLHAPYLEMAREELGKLKNKMMLGGLSQLGHRVTLETGATIVALSNNGVDEIRIDVPKPSIVEEKKKPPPDENPYFWVGSRIMWEQLPPDLGPFDPGTVTSEYSMMVIEPGDNAIVTGFNQFWQTTSFNEARWVEPFHPSMTPTTFLPLNLDLQDENWPQVGRLGQPWIPYRRWQYIASSWVGDAVGQQNVQFTRNLLIHKDAYVGNDEQTFPWAPYDPLHEDEVSNRVFPPDYFAQKTLWDQVAYCDPDPGGKSPTDRRSEEAGLIGALAAHTGPPRCLAGEYVIKFVAVGPDCPEDNPEGLPFPLNGWDEPLKHLYLPTPIEVEVRVGKEPNTVTLRHQLTIPSYTQFFSNLWPFGDFDNPDTECQQLFERKNNHNNCWWQGAIIANPMQRTIRIEEEFAPSPIFEGEKWNLDALCSDRSIMEVYVYIWPPFSDPLLHDYIAADVHNIIEFAFGFELGAEVTEAEIKAASQAAGIEVGRLYFYDIPTNTFTNADASYSELWEDDLRRKALLNGRRFAKVVFGAVLPLPLCTTSTFGIDSVAYSCDPEDVRAAYAGNGCEDIFSGD